MLRQRLSTCKYPHFIWNYSTNGKLAFGSFVIYEGDKEIPSDGNWDTDLTPFNVGVKAGRSRMTNSKKTLCLWPQLSDLSYIFRTMKFPGRGTFMASWYSLEVSFSVFIRDYRNCHDNKREVSNCIQFFQFPIILYPLNIILTFFFYGKRLHLHYDSALPLPSFIPERGIQLFTGYVLWDFPHSPTCALVQVSSSHKEWSLRLWWILKTPRQLTLLFKARCHWRSSADILKMPLGNRTLPSADSVDAGLWV